MGVLGGAAGAVAAAAAVVIRAGGSRRADARAMHPFATGNASRPARDTQAHLRYAHNFLTFR